MESEGTHEDVGLGDTVLQDSEALTPAVLLFVSQEGSSRASKCSSSSDGEIVGKMIDGASGS